MNTSIQDSIKKFSDSKATCLGQKNSASFTRETWCYRLEKDTPGILELY